QSGNILRLEMIYDLPGGERLEVTDLLRDVRRGCDEVEVVFEDYVAVDRESAAVLQELPGVVDDLNCFWAREDGKPPHDGAREEVCVFIFAEAVPRSAHGALRDAERPDVRSHAERGNELGSFLRDCLVQVQQNTRYDCVDGQVVCPQPLGDRPVLTSRCH